MRSLSNETSGWATPFRVLLARCTLSEGDAFSSAVAQPCLRLRYRGLAAIHGHRDQHVLEVLQIVMPADNIRLAEERDLNRIPGQGAALAACQASLL